MARRRVVTAKQRAASRRNIRKAQIVSARKRKGTGRKRPVSRTRTVNRTRTVSRKPLRDVGSVKRSTARAQMPVGARTRVRRHATRHARRYRIAGKVVSSAMVVGAGAAYGYDLHKNVRIYHNTDKRHVAGIRNTGLQGVKPGSFSHTRFGERPGDVFVSKGINTTKMFGDHIVKVKMPRSEFNKHASRDRNMPPGMRAYKIDEMHLGKHNKGVKYRIRRGGPMQKVQYKAMFPDGTKESYKPRR